MKPDFEKQVEELMNRNNYLWAITGGNTSQSFYDLTKKVKEIVRQSYLAGGNDKVEEIISKLNAYDDVDFYYLADEIRKLKTEVEG